MNMDKEYFDAFEVCYENTHDEIITTQFKRERSRYLDRTVRRAYEVFKVQQQKLDEYILVAETLDELYVKEVEKNRKLQKRVDACQKLLVELKESKVELVECDLYDKGVRCTLYSVIHDLEQALKGDNFP